MSERDSRRTALIVGGGPAGMAAARELLACGVRVTLLEEMPELGGQYYRRPSVDGTIERGKELDERAAIATELIEELKAQGLEIRCNALVWGVFPDKRVAVYEGDRVSVMEADAVVLATGAIEQVVAFPGWTLPGVMTAGAVQSVISREAILPGRRFLLAGTGPLLLAIALEIAEAGGEVVAIVEGSHLTNPARHVLSFLSQGRRLRQAAQYHLALRRHGIPIEYSHTVVAAHGEGQVREVEVARIDRDWHVVPGPTQRYQVDALCLHYGFAACTELARMAGCEVAYAAERGGWYVVHDDGMRTSQPGIYVAGQPAGIGGVDLAEATGKLAGLTAAYDLDGIDARSYLTAAQEMRRDVERAQDVAFALNVAYRPGPAVVDLIAPSTLVCRCEAVPASEVDAAIREGARTLDDVKRRTRCGMGYCQGRVCSPVVAALLQHRGGVTPEKVGLFTARPPVKPIPLAALATLLDTRTSESVQR